LTFSHFPRHHTHCHSQSSAFDFSNPTTTTTLSNPIIMVHISKLAAAVTAFCLASSSAAHPGEHHDHHAIKREVIARDAMASAAKRSLDSCSGTLKHRQLAARSIARRSETARQLRAARNIQSSKFSHSILYNLASRKIHI
jgi:hypothetical protein